MAAERRHRRLRVALRCIPDLGTQGLLALETGLGEGRLVGFLADTHVYVNHVDGLEEQLSREPYGLPSLRTEPFTSLFDWKYEDSRVEGYEHHPRIKFAVAV